MKRLLLASAALAMSAGASYAQTDLEGLVNVNIQDVLQDIALDLNVEENNIPVTIQLPVSVAANVCDVSVNVLSAQLSTGDATCAAVTGSQELTQVVQQEMEAGGSDNEDTASTDDDSTDDGSTDDTASTDDGSTDDGGTDDTASTDDGADDGTEDTADADDETDDTTTSGIANENSAREFAPGQQDEPANEVAPGKQDNPKAAAPGQRKKVDGDDEETE